MSAIHRAEYEMEQARHKMELARQFNNKASHSAYKQQYEYWRKEWRQLLIDQKVKQRNQAFEQYQNAPNAAATDYYWKIYQQLYKEVVRLMENG